METFRARGAIRFAILLIASLLVSGLVVIPHSSAYAAACGLAGLGTADSPWLVGSRADFRLVAKGNCLASGHYRQTADLTGSEMLSSYSDQVGADFTGVYDGDHYRIELGGSAPGGWAETVMQTQVMGLFYTLKGVVKKVRLTGVIHSHSGLLSSLVAGSLARVVDGGLISEVSSDVRIVKSAGSNKLNFGGLVGVNQGASSRIEYSSFTGSVEWAPTVAPLDSQFGGLIFSVVSPTEFDIRDSYASFSGTIARPDGTTAILDLGGLMGITDTTGTVRIIRSYASPRVTVTGPTTGVSDGGILGWQYRPAPQLVSVFWQADQATKAVGRGTVGPAAYTSGLPVAVPLSETHLQTLSSYQTKEGSTGQPGGAELAVAASTGTLAEQDYRWAIEQGNVSVFIPSPYSTASNYLTRQLYTDTSVARVYQTRGTNLEGTATGYPTLGRVWEICPEMNGGFPVLVWQEFDCPSLEASSSAAPSTNSNPKPPELAATGGSPLGLLVGMVFISLGVLARRLARRAGSA